MKIFMPDRNEEIGKRNRVKQQEKFSDLQQFNIGRSHGHRV